MLAPQRLPGYSRKTSTEVVRYFSRSSGSEKTIQKVEGEVDQWADNFQAWSNLLFKFSASVRTKTARPESFLDVRLMMMMMMSSSTVLLLCTHTRAHTHTKKKIIASCYPVPSSRQTWLFAENGVEHADLGSPIASVTCCRSAVIYHLQADKASASVATSPRCAR